MKVEMHFPQNDCPESGSFTKQRNETPANGKYGVVLGITFRLSQPIPPFHPLSARSFLSLLWHVYSLCTFPLSPHFMNCRCLGSQIAKHTLASRCHPFASVCRLGAEAASCAYCVMWLIYHLAVLTLYKVTLLENNPSSYRPGHLSREISHLSGHREP